MFYAFALTIVIAMHTLVSSPLTLGSSECDNYTKTVLKGQDKCVCFGKKKDHWSTLSRKEKKTHTIHQNDETTHLLTSTS